MTFDYRGWGESEGVLRNAINPKQRVRDANAALEHLKSFPEIDSKKIVLWGSSFGGGHVIELAAEHHDLLGAIAHVPMLNGMLAVRAVPPLRDRKSTRLNSSHVRISYAVFCLKKKK